MGPRIILYTGKGGVGKTSVAAATARRAAADGQRVVLLSTDTAGSLSDILETPVAAEAVEVAPRLTAQQIDTRAEIEHHWGELRSWLVAALTERGLEQLRAEELALPPGLDDITGLLELRRQAGRDDLDLIIVDCAASGEALRLLAVPDAARWWLDRAIGHRGWDAARPLAKAALDISLPRGTAVTGAARLLRDLASVCDILRDHDRVSIRLVLTPDRMVIAETRRTYTYLNLFGLLTDAVVINRVFPSNVGSYFDAWRTHQADACREVTAAFAPVPALQAPYYATEVTGPTMLDRLATDLFAEIDDPTALLYATVCEQLELAPEAATLRLALPFAEKDQVRVQRDGDALIVRVSDRTRTVTLPRALRDYRPNGASLDRGVLTVTLIPPPQ